MLECCNLKKVWHFLDCGGGGTPISETNNGHRLHGSTADWTWDYETECGGSFLFNIQGRTLLSFFIASSAQIKL